MKLLKQVCLTFKRDFEACAAFDPFEQMTIALACNRYLRMHCLTPETNASEPLFGWRGHVNHSKIAIEWLTWYNDRLQTERWSTLSEDESEAHDMMALAYDDCADQYHPLYQSHIQHSRKVGEHRIPGTHYAVDGYDPQTHTVYEFYGCFWHGCRTCQPQRTETRCLGCRSRALTFIQRKTEKRPHRITIEPSVRVGHLRRNTLVNLESAFARLIS